VVDGELRWVLYHEGGTGSEEGPMAEDDDGRRWELTVRGMGGSVLLEKGREWGRERKRGVVPILNGTWRWGGSAGRRHVSGVEEGTRRGGR
jgi:hypothetical protein